MGVKDTIESLELPVESTGYRLIDEGGRRAAIEKRRDLLAEKPRVYIGRLDSDFTGQVGEALLRVGAERLLSPGQQVAIKVNLGGGVRGVPSSFTDPLVVEGVVDMVRSLGAEPFICEANMRTFTVDRAMLVRRGYYPLLARKEVEFVNLSSLDHIDFYPRGWHTPIRLPEALLHPQVKIISVPALKHHWECGVTLAQKNMYGAISERMKSLFHRGGAIDESVAAAARAMAPDLSLLAHRQVGGRLGPHFCIPVDFGYAIASDNMLAADRVGCEMMGYDWSLVRYGQMNADGREIDYELMEGSVSIDPDTLRRIRETAMTRPEVYFWRALLYPQYFVPHSTQHKHLFRLEGIGTVLNWLLFHTRGDPWPSDWPPATLTQGREGDEPEGAEVD